MVAKETQGVQGKRYYNKAYKKVKSQVLQRLNCLIGCSAKGYRVIRAVRQKLE
jgi:hypothetical protein